MKYELCNKCTVLGKNVQKPEINISFLSYLLKGDKNILIDTVPRKSANKFMEELRECVEIQALDAIIFNHSQEDHTGALNLLLREVPDVPIYCTENCKKRLLPEYPEGNFVTVGHNSEIQIGEFLFRFIHTPGLHWDDNMVTYWEEEHILFSNDLFGQYLAAEPPVEESVTEEELSRGVNKYLKRVFPDATREEKKGILSIEPCDFKMIATGHGLLLKDSARKVFETYKEFSLSKV